MTTRILCVYSTEFEGFAGGYSVCKIKTVANPKFVNDSMAKDGRKPEDICPDFSSRSEDFDIADIFSRKKHQI